MARASSNKSREELIRRFADTDYITKAIGDATTAAVLDHKRSGNPIAAWQNGQVAIIQPKDIVAKRQPPK